MKWFGWLISIGILILSILASKCLSPFFNELSLPVFLTGLTISFGFAQYQISKRHTEERRLNDLRISAYNNLTAQANIILEESSKMLIDLHPNAPEKSKESISHIGVTLPAKLNRLDSDINFFRRLLNMSIDNKEIVDIKNHVDEVLKNPATVHPVEFYAEIYAKVHDSVNKFAEKLTNEIL